MNWFDRFAHPWLLALAIPLVPIVWYDWMRSARRASVRFSNTNDLIAAAGGPSWAIRARVLLPVLRSLAVLLIVIALARPQRADELTRITTEGVAIELVLDRSSSMRQRDLVDENGHAHTRLDAVKQVVRHFIEGQGDNLPGRLGDLIGLTVFAGYPDTVCPLTRDHEHLIRAMQEVQVPTVKDEDGTAIGDALLLGLERIHNIGRQSIADQSFKIKSRAIILLTDGEQNAGKFKPIQAAEAARALDVKIYAIGAAPAYQVIRGPFGNTRQRVPIDERALKQIADETGGKYFRATDTSSLADIYAEIDKLERSQIDEQRYYLYEELAYQPIRVGSIDLPPPLLVALVLLALETLLGNTRFRRVP